MLWQNPKRNRSDIIAFQNRKLRRIIAHTYANVVHYRELFDQVGLTPNSIRSVEDLQLIPLTAKSDLRVRPLEEILSAGIKPHKLVRLKTSGSSGQPFTIRRTPLEEHLINMFRIRACRQFGVRISDRITYVREKWLGGRERGFLGRFRQAMGIYRDNLVDCFQSAHGILRELEKIQPDVVGGYPSALGYAAALARSYKFRIRPRLMITGGEVLSSVTRDRIEGAFSSRVFDAYGAHEFNLLAWQCPKESLYHVCDDNVIVEIIKSGRPAQQGETGEIVATALHSYAMPFIRYRTGDIATKGPTNCPCGQPFSTLLNIQGRTTDYLRLPEDRYVHPYEITNPLIDREGDWIFQHQVIQETINRVILRIVPMRPPHGKELERVMNLGKSKLGRGVMFEIELTNEFPVEPGKKFSPYICIAKEH